jgi:hypothetical protein
MSARGGFGPELSPRTRTLQLVTVLGLALVAAFLVVSAELAPEDATTKSGPYGFLLIQAAGALGLFLTSVGRRRAAYAVASLFVINAIFFLAIETELVGPNLVLIAADLSLLFVSGLVGAWATVSALRRMIGNGPQQPILPAAVIAMVAASVVGASVASGTVLAPITPPPYVRPSPPQITPTATPPRTSPPPSPSPSRVQQLTLIVVGNGSVTVKPGELVCSTKCAYPLGEGVVATLTASAGSDSIFSRWTGCSQPCSVKMDGAREVQATFNQPTVRVSFSGDGKGIVTSSPKGIVCPPTCEAPFPRGSSVTLAAAPGTDNAFTGWTDTCARSGLGTCPVLVSTNIDATAEFQPFIGNGFQAKNGTECGGVPTLHRGEAGQFSECFSNSGNMTWQKSKVQIWQCCPLGGPSPISGWNSGWPSAKAYADVTTDVVAPGSDARFNFSVKVPDNAEYGDYHLDGYLVEVGSGRPIAGGGFSILVKVVPK